MMQKKQKNKKNLFWLILVVVLLVAGVSGYFVMSLINGSNENKEEISEYMEQNEYDETMAESEDVAEKAVREKKVTQYEGDDPNNSDTLTGVVTYAAVDGDNLVIMTNIDQFLTTGTCGLTLLRGGASIYSSIANIIGDVSTSTCEGFEIPISELGGGEMEININLNSGERTGVIRGEVNI